MCGKERGYGRDFLDVWQIKELGGESHGCAGFRAKRKVCEAAARALCLRLRAAAMAELRAHDSFLGNCGKRVKPN